MSKHLIHRPQFRLTGERVQALFRLFSPFSQGEICVCQALPEIIGVDGLSPGGDPNGTLAHEVDAALAGFSQTGTVSSWVSRGESHGSFHGNAFSLGEA